MGEEGVIKHIYSLPQLFRYLSFLTLKLDTVLQPSCNNQSMKTTNWTLVNQIHMDCSMSFGQSINHELLEWSK